MDRRTEGIKIYSEGDFQHVIGVMFKDRIYFGGGNNARYANLSLSFRSMYATFLTGRKIVLSGI